MKTHSQVGGEKKGGIRGKRGKQQQGDSLGESHRLLHLKFELNNVNTTKAVWVCEGKPLV